VVDWVSAGGEVAGAIGTFAAVVVALWVSIRSAQRQRAEQIDREAGQARLITTELRHEDGRWWVRTTNHSTAPIFDARILGVRHAGGVGMVEPAPGAPVEVTTLTAGQSVDRAVAANGVPANAVIVLQFLDAVGLRWRREGAAQPKRILD
jgi:hypothetical protein